MRLLAAALAVGVLAATIGLLVGSSQARSERAATGEIQVTARNVVHTYRTLGRPGRVSDASEQAWSLRNRHGRTIGRLVIVCRWITDRDRLCTGAIRMPLGTIAVTGSTPTSFYGELVVVGGTGRYDGADGRVVFTAIGRGRMVLTATLT